MTINAGNVIADLRQSYETLTLSQKRIAELVVDDPEFVAFATVDKLAARLGVSPSTIVRFTYRLGLNGYPELQNKVRELVRSQMRPGVRPDGETRALTEHLGTSVAASSLAHDIENLRHTIARLSAADFDQSVSLLVSARTVYVAGGFASDSLAQYVALALDRMRGRTVVLNGDVHTAPHLLDIGPEDTVLAFSFPPYASRTLQIVRAARERGARIVAITDTPVAPIAQRVDVVLASHVSGLGPQNSIVAPMALANALLNAVILQTPESTERYAGIFRLMNEWDSFLLRGDDD